MDPQFAVLAVVLNTSAADRVIPLVVCEPA
jgi:hypothetical protein